MSLTLTITGYQRLLPGQETSKTLEEGTLTIGRAPKNDWILQDPDRILSGQHCSIEDRDGHYFITDTSTNGVFLNDAEERLERGHTVQLNDGDRLLLGDYEITVQISISNIPSRDSDIGENKAHATDIAPATSDVFSGGPPSGPARSDVLPDDPFTAPSAHGKPSTAADDLRPEDSGLLGLGPSTPISKRQITEADHLSPEREFIQPPDTNPEEEEFAEPDVAQDTSTASPEESVEKASFKDEEGLIPDNWWQEDIESPHDVQAIPEGESMPLPEEDKPTSEPSIPESPPKEELVASLEKKYPESIPTVSEQKASPEAVDKATVPSSSIRDQQKPVEVPISSPQQTHEAIVKTFIKGAGLKKLPISEDQYEAVMENVGQMFRETVQGIMEILLARSSVKGEFRLERTTLGPLENNPLKTPPGRTPLSVEETMTLLLSESSQGFMPPVQAVKESLEDIKAHQLAVMAGIQSALTLLLERFDPNVLEKRLSQDSMLDNLLPGKRKAKYWDSFKALYAQLAKEAEDDFNNFFGKEFAKAYEEQLRKL